MFINTSLCSSAKPPPDILLAFYLPRLCVFFWRDARPTTPVRSMKIIFARHSAIHHTFEFLVFLMAENKKIIS